MSVPLGDLSPQMVRRLLRRYPDTARVYVVHPDERPSRTVYVDPRAVMGPEEASQKGPEIRDAKEQGSGVIITNQGALVPFHPGIMDVFRTSRRAAA